MKTFLIALTFMIVTQAFADKEKIEKNMKMPLYTRESMQVIYPIDNKSEVYAFFQPYTLSTQIHSKRRILHAAVMQTATQGLYTLIDPDFVISNEAVAEVRGHCLNYIGDGKGKESDKNPNEFLYLFFEFNQAQKKVNFHKIILHEGDPAIREKFDVLYAICADYQFTPTQKIKIGKGPERQFQEVLPELKQPILQLDSTSLERPIRK